MARFALGEIVPDQTYTFLLAVSVDRRVAFAAFDLKMFSGQRKLCAGMIEAVDVFPSFREVAGLALLTEFVLMWIGMAGSAGAGQPEICRAFAFFQKLLQRRIFAVPGEMALSALYGGMLPRKAESRPGMVKILLLEEHGFRLPPQMLFMALDARPGGRHPMISSFLIPENLDFRMAREAFRAADFFTHFMTVRAVP